MATPEPQNPQTPQNPQLPQHPSTGPAPHEERPPDRRRTDIKEAPENAREAVDAGETEPLPEERHREPPAPREERKDPPNNDPAVDAPPDPNQPESERTT